MPDSYRMSNEDVLHEKSIATTGLELRVRRAPWWHDGEETRATCSSARIRASEPGWIAQVGFFGLAEDVRFLQAAAGNGAVWEAGIRVLSLLKGFAVARWLAHVSLAPGRNQSSQTSMTRDTTATSMSTRMRRGNSTLRTSRCKQKQRGDSQICFFEEREMSEGEDTLRYQCQLGELKNVLSCFTSQVGLFYGCQ